MQKLKLSSQLYIDNVLGICPECHEEAFLISILQYYYRCTYCGQDTRQFVNGVIKYMKLSNDDKEYIKAHGKKS